MKRNITTLLALTVLVGATGYAQDRGERQQRTRERDRAVAPDRLNERQRIRERGRAVAPTRVDSNIDWDAKYKKYLQDNPRIKEAVESGKITKEKVIAGIKAREEENRKQPTVDEQMEKEYQQMLEENPRLAQAIETGRITKEAMMQRLNNRAGAARRGRAGEAEAVDAAGRPLRGAERGKVALREKLGEFVRQGKITRTEAGDLFRAAFPDEERGNDVNRRDRSRRPDNTKREEEGNRRR